MEPCNEIGRDSKHLKILQSIDGIELSINRLQNFFDEVSGVMEEKTPPIDTKPHVPSLSEVLDSAPGSISGLALKIDKLVCDLRSVLF